MTQLRLALLIAVASLLIACSERETTEERYRQGVLFEQQGRRADAMREYQLAAGDGFNNEEYALKAVNAIGHLYLSAGNRDEALTQFRRSFDLASSGRDTVMMVLALRDMSRCLRTEEWLPSAENCFERADQLITTAQLDSLRPQVWPEWLSVLMQTNNHEAVQKRLDALIALDGQMPLDASAWLTIGRAYMMLGQMREATQSLQRAAESGNVKTNAAATMLLSQLEGAGGHYEAAWLSAMESVAMMDSVERQSTAMNSDLVDSLSGQIGVERENARLRLRLVLLGVVALLSVGVVVAFFRWRLQRLQAQAVTQSRQQEEQRLASVQQNRSRQDDLLAAFRQTAVYAECDRIGQGGSGDLSEESWQQLQALLNEHADGFVNRLVVFYPKLKPAELRLCCLIRLGLSNLQISNIFHRTQQATTNARKRLYARMFDRDGSADELNQFILSF